MTCAQPSLVRHRRPGPVGLGRRTAKSTGTINLPSPMTTRRSTPSIPSTTRLCWPLHHVPTSSSWSPYFRNTESSRAHVHCQRLRVAALMASRWRQSDPRTSWPSLRRRLSQERLGKAPRMREGKFLSHPRARVNSKALTQPNIVGNMRPKILPSNFFWVLKRPSISVTRLSGKPKSSRAWWRASISRWARFCWRSWRSLAPRRRRVMALACFLTYCRVRDMVHSFVSWLRELKIEGNHAPCGSDIAKESLGGTGCVPKCLRKKNFQDLSRGRPRRFYVRAQNGKVSFPFGIALSAGERLCRFGFYHHDFIANNP